MCVPASGGTLRGAGLKPERSLKEDCVTTTQGFPTTVDRDLRVCRCVVLFAHDFSPCFENNYSISQLLSNPAKVRLQSSILGH